MDELLTELLAFRGGCLKLPDAPALGLEHDQAVVDSLTLAPSERIPAGNYANLVFGDESHTSVPPYPPREYGR